MKNSRISISEESQEAAGLRGRRDNGLGRPIQGHTPVLGAEERVFNGAEYRPHVQTLTHSLCPQPVTPGDGLI